MSNQTSARTVSRQKRQQRVRAHIKGCESRPRLCVFRSNKHVYAQVIDDDQRATLVSASSLSPEFKAGEGKKSGKPAAEAVGLLVAKRCAEKGITQVVFDRNGFIFKKNGLIATLAEGARKGGLKF